MSSLFLQIKNLHIMPVVFEFLRLIFYIYIFSLNFSFKVPK